MHTNKYAQIATCTVWWWWWLWLIVFLYGGDCIGGCTYVVVVAVPKGDGHPCAVGLLLCDCIRAWWLWSVMNEDAT